MKKKLKKIIKENLADIFLAAQEETPVETPVETPSTPTTRPSTPGRPLKIPKKWPDNLPKPKPKAKKDKKFDFSVNEDFVKKGVKSIALAKELRKMKRVIKENVLREMGMRIDDPDFAGEPHPEVRRGIEGGKPTAFSDVDFFKGGEEGYSTLEKIGSEEFNKIIEDLRELGQMSTQQIIQTFNLMKQLEQPHARQLEQLALNKVQQQFGLPDEIMDKLKAKLVQNVDAPDDEDDEGDMEEEVMDDLEFTDEEKAIIKKHVDKRKIQNALMMGAGYRAHSIFNDIENDLNRIDPRLYPLYMQVMPNVSLFMWMAPLEDMMDQAQMMGRSEIKEEETGEQDENGEPEKEVKAEAQAVNFPILLHEVAKAAIELLFAQYLLDLGEAHGARIYKEVLKQSDVFHQEIWMKRIGPTLWKYLHDIIDYIVTTERNNDYTIVAYLLNRISLMEPEDFVELMKKVVYNGTEAVSELNSMLDTIEGEIEDYEEAREQTPAPEDLDTGTPITRPDIEDELLKVANDAINKTTQQKEDRPEKSLSDMNADELNTALQTALEGEDYEMAAKIRDEFNSRV